MVKVKGLGRGLDALLGGDDNPAPTQDRQAEVKTDLLQPGKYQPRTHMDEAALKELAESIKAQGVIQPILVRPVANGRFEIIAGERRWRAARMAGLEAVPALVRDVSDNAALAMALIENIQREDLDPLEQAKGIQRLVDEFGATHDKAAEMLGRSRSAVSNLLRLLALSAPVRELVQQRKIDMGHARALLALSGIQQIETARLIASQGLSVRDTERLVAKLLKGTTTRKAARSTDRDVLRLEEDLAEKLGTKVAIKQRSQGRGTLLIDYTTLAQLDVILARLTQ
jgi:ParB family chromosome partitioning protein